MPLITQILPQKRRENRRNIYLDGHFAFGCHDNTVARFRLTVGKELSKDDVDSIEFGEVKQQCFDRAMDLLTRRLHSRAEISRKLQRQEWGTGVIEAVLNDLTRLGYIDDERFARAKAESAAKRKHHGKRRAFQELLRTGVTGEVANKAVAEIYTENDPKIIARELALKHATRLKRLDRDVARRRLTGLLQRRGFDYDAIRPLLDEVLGKSGDVDFPE